MYKVIIVDDEKYVRKSIRNRINWNQYGLEVIAEAGNGEEAYNMVVQFNPDILLADIRMPLVDGIELIKMLAKEYSHIKVIILSAYDDFEYAKQAILLGVENYIKKPIDEIELEKTLCDIVSELEGREGSSKLPSLELSMITKAVYQKKYFMILAFYIQTEFYGENIELFQYNLYNRLKNASFVKMYDIELYIIDGMDSDKGILFLANSDMLSEAGMRTALNKVGKEYKEDQENIKLIVGTTEVFDDPQDIIKKADIAISILKYKIVMGDLTVLSEKNTVSFNYTEPIKEYQNLNLIYDMIVKDEMDKAHIMMTRLAEHYINRKYSIAGIEYLIEEMINLLKKVNQMTRPDYDFNTVVKTFRKNNYVLLYNSLDELKNDLQRVIDFVFEQKMLQSGRDIIQNIKLYIKNNYSEKLSVNHIAAKYHLSAAYLSVLFKEKTNTTLSAYIEEVRMDMAKKLICDDICNIADTAFAVGYTDPNYFCKVFKRYTGITPSKFKEQLSNQNKKGIAENE